MEISSASLWALAAILAINSLFIAALAVALFLVHQKLGQGLERATPVLQQAADTLARLEEHTGQVQERIDLVLDRTSELVDTVSRRVDTATAIAEEAVTEPLIGAASLMAGINQGLRTYSERAAEKGDGRDV